MIWVLRRRQHGAEPSPRVRLVLLGGYASIFGGYFTVLRVATPTSGRLDLFPQLVGLMMVDLVLLVYPVLLVAAVDFGEWGGLVGERVAADLKGWRASWATPVAVVLSASLALFGYLHLATGPAELSATRLWRASRTVVLVSVGLGLIIMLGRAVGTHRRRWPAAFNFAVIFATCATLSYLISPLSGWLTSQFSQSKPIEQVSAAGEFTATADVLSDKGGSGATAFTLLIPRGWLHGGSAGVDLWTNYGVPGAKPGQADPPYERVGVTSLPAAVNAALVAKATGLTIVGAQQTDGVWTRVEIKKLGERGLIWTRADRRNPRRTVLVEEFVKGVSLQNLEPALLAVAHSLRTASEPSAALPEGEPTTGTSQLRRASDRLQATNLAISGGLVLCLLIGVAVAGRRWPRLAVASVLVFGMVTIATMLYFADSLGRVIHGPRTRWPYVSQFGMLMSIGVLGLVAIAIAARRHAKRRRTLIVGLIALDATAWALQGMTSLYEHALSVSRVSGWAAVTVLVAIAWDVTMSGESLTNHGSKNFPRSTRMLGFLGYVLLLAATVLFYSAQHGAVTGKMTESFFEPEAVTRDGLFRIALPVAVLLFLLRFGRDPEPVPTDPPPLPERRTDTPSGPVAEWADSEQVTTR